VGFGFPLLHSLNEKVQGEKSGYLPEGQERFPMKCISGLRAFRTRKDVCMLVLGDERELELEAVGQQL
jgi:hypothetical protein